MGCCYLLWTVADSFAWSSCCCCLPTHAWCMCQTLSLCYLTQRCSFGSVMYSFYTHKWHIWCLRCVSNVPFGSLCCVIYLPLSFLLHQCWYVILLTALCWHWHSDWDCFLVFMPWTQGSSGPNGTDVYLKKSVLEHLTYMSCWLLVDFWC